MRKRALLHHLLAATSVMNRTKTMIMTIPADAPGDGIKMGRARPLARNSSSLSSREVQQCSRGEQVRPMDGVSRRLNQNRVFVFLVGWLLQ